jgi:hypothetical protein
MECLPEWDGPDSDGGEPVFPPGDSRSGSDNLRKRMGKSMKAIGVGQDSCKGL